MKKTKAGVAICDINPAKGVALGGYPHVARKNIGIHDNLYASVLYVESGASCVFVSLDLVSFSKQYSDRIRLEVEKKTGINRSSIFIMCTHTHSSPYCIQLIEATGTQGKIDEGYIESVIKKITDAIIKASQNTFIASIGFGKGICGAEKGVGGNRQDPNETSDPEISVLAVKDENDMLRACIANYALHPTFLHAENLLVSADYPGYIREYINADNPDAVFLFAQGTSGDQSSRYFRSGQSFDEAKRVGYALGEEICNTISLMKYSDSAEIKIKSKKLDNFLKEIPTIEQAEKNLEAVKSRYERLKSENAEYAKLRSVECNIFGAERTLEYATLTQKNMRLPRIKEEHPMELGAVFINDARLIFLQGELFVRFGLDMKKNSGQENTFVIEMTNGDSAGYIYTKEAMETYGGYEVETSQYSPQMGEYIVEEAKKLMDNQ